MRARLWTSSLRRTIQARPLPPSPSLPLSPPPHSSFSSNQNQNPNPNPDNKVHQPPAAAAPRRQRVGAVRAAGDAQPGRDLRGGVRRHDVRRDRGHLPRRVRPPPGGQAGVQVPAGRVVPGRCVASRGWGGRARGGQSALWPRPAAASARWLRRPHSRARAVISRLDPLVHELESYAEPARRWPGGRRAGAAPRLAGHALARTLHPSPSTISLPPSLPFPFDSCAPCR